MEFIFPVIAITLLVVGLVGQGFEMKKIRASITKDEDLGSPKIFTDKRNLKWYVLIGAGMVIWYATGGF